mmetsp:Transcript_10526/g.34616  ORF Transcript_10526/g.34616 Transcript_10526/m.34616 type:complete len:284 (-) Transcript_10526:86-937(-)
MCWRVAMRWRRADWNRRSSRSSPDNSSVATRASLSALASSRARRLCSRSHSACIASSAACSLQRSSPHANLSPFLLSSGGSPPALVRMRPSRPSRSNVVSCVQSIKEEEGRKKRNQENERGDVLARKVQMTALLTLRRERGEKVRENQSPHLQRGAVDCACVEERRHGVSLLAPAAFAASALRALKGDYRRPRRDIEPLRGLRWRVGKVVRHELAEGPEEGAAGSRVHRCVTARRAQRVAQRAGRRAHRRRAAPVRVRRRRRSEQGLASGPPIGLSARASPVC